MKTSVNLLFILFSCKLENGKLQCLMYLWGNSPADVINGDVPKLLIHGGLALLARMGAEC